MKKKSKEIEINYTDNAKDFIGIKLEDSIVSVYLPSYYCIDETNEKEKRSSILKFLKTIKLCKSHNYENALYNDLSINGGNWAIDSYIWVIEDYITNGDFLNLDKKYSKSNRGKINWKRTLKNIPHFSQNNYVYLDFYVSKNEITRDSVTDIYRYCLNIALVRIGWLYGYNFQVHVNIQTSLGEMISLVNRELKSTFDDNKLLRLKNIMKILNEVSSNSSYSQTSFGTNNYYVAYELMIDRMFCNVADVDKSKYLPQAEWVINNNVTQSSKLKPDTICRVGRDTYVIDSKMYSYGSENSVKNLPSTVDINKQITYGEYANKAFEDEEIYNVFILPYAGDDNFSYIGYASANWKDNINTYEKVHAVLMNFNYLVDNYSLSDSYPHKEIADLIKENNNKTAP